VPEKLSEELNGDITIPPGIFHNVACTGAEDAEMIDVYSQGTRRFELEKDHEPKYRSYEH